MNSESWAILLIWTAVIALSVTFWGGVIYLALHILGER
jgi:hypothetical protein